MGARTLRSLGHHLLHPLILRLLVLCAPSDFIEQTACPDVILKITNPGCLCTLNQRKQFSKFSSFDLEAQYNVLVTTYAIDTLLWACSCTGFKIEKRNFVQCGPLIGFILCFGQFYGVLCICEFDDWKMDSKYKWDFTFEMASSLGPTCPFGI